MAQVVNDHLRLELTAPCRKMSPQRLPSTASTVRWAGAALLLPHLFEVQSKHMPHHSVKADMVAMYVVQRDVQASSDFNTSRFGKMLSASLMRERNGDCFLLFSR